MLKTRVVTSVISLIIIGVALFALPLHYTEWLIGLLLVAGAWEWSGFLNTTSFGYRAAYTTIIAACLAIVHFVIPDKTPLILQIACVWWFVAFLWNLRFPTAIPTPVRWLCGLLVIVPLYSALVMLIRFGIEYLVFTMLIVWAADAGAYFAGKKFGRVKLAPAISPKKTWEGVIGGLLVVGILAVAVAVSRELSIAVFLPFCLAVGAISVVGDLTVSMFKRTAGVKDSGKLCPGHGGVLDRVDSVAAAAPMFALGVNWLGLA
jgi:phosphatidate cytidylyltransferase